MTTRPDAVHPRVRPSSRPAAIRRGLALPLLFVLAAAGPTASGRQQQAPQAPPQPAPQAPQAPPATPPPVPPGQVPPLTFETAVELVSVDVSVVDKAGLPVRGLTKDDFELEVDGEPRLIASSMFVEQSAKSGPPVTEQFSTNEGATGGRLLMLIVDQGNIRQQASTAFIRAGRRLLDDLGPGDRVALAVIPGGTVMDFTPHLASVRTALDRAVGTLPRYQSSGGNYLVSVSEALAYEGGNEQVLGEVAQRECVSLPRQTEVERDPVAICMRDLENELTNLAQFVQSRTVNSLTALRRLLTGLAKVRGPKTLVLLSEGLYLGRDLSQISWVSEVAAAARASLYAVVLDDTFTDMDTSARRSSPTTTEDRRLRHEGIDTLVGMTRGNAQFVSSGAEGAFERLSREFTGYYLLGFEPASTERDGKSHNIRVRVKRPGVEIRARRTFSVDAAASAARPAEEVLAETLRDPLLATEVRLRVATYSFPDPATGEVRLLITAGLGQPTDDAPVTDVAFRLVDDDGKLVSGRFEPAPRRTDRDHRWNGTAVVEPGTYMLKVAAVDSDGRRGSVEHRLTAALTSIGALRLGDLMLTEAGVSSPEVLKPEIEPRVTAGGVDGYVELYAQDTAALKDVTATLEIAGDANAATLMSAPIELVATKSASRRVGQAEVMLLDLPPGEYVARAVISLGGKPVGRVLRSFSFTPSAEVRARGSGGATSLAMLRPRFEPRSVLQGDVLERMLKPVAQSGPTGAVAAAMAQAAQGDLARIPETLRPGGDDPATALLRGIGLYARGELEPAAAEFRRALRADSELSAAAFYLGACYAAGGRDREAVGAWQTTLAAEQLDPVVFALTAEAYLRLKDWPAAIDAAREAAVAWPDDPGVQRQLIRAQALGGQRREALQAIDAFVGRQPADHEVALLGMKLLYDAAADARPVATPRDDLARFERYLAAYRAAKGPEVALAERWKQVVSSRLEN